MSTVPPEVVKDLAPTGKLRAAINQGNSVLVQKQADGSEPKGVTIMLAKELGKRLGVPVELVLFGSDRFRRFGSDDGADGQVFDVLQLGFVAWSAALLLIGVRAVHGWSWWRSLAALGLVALFLTAYGYISTVL